MKDKKDFSQVKTNTVLFVNHFIEYIGKTVLELSLSLKQKSAAPTVLSLFVADMTKTLNKESLSLESNNTTELNRLIYLSYIKSYFLPVAYELASSYEEQLGLLQSSDAGVIRFAHHIAQCSTSILKKDERIKDRSNPLDKSSLKLLFVLAGINQSAKVNSNKLLALTSSKEVSVSEFMSNIGVRQQIVRAISASNNKRYQYYTPAKKKIKCVKYGHRNSIYNEVIGKGSFVPVQDENNIPHQSSYIIFATLDDIKEYLKSFRNNQLDYYDFGIDRFFSYMSNLYFQGNKNITVYCTQLDFRDFDMSMATFDDVIFNRCNFNGADLTNTSFNGCAIFDSQFKGALLNGTKFNRAKLNFIDLTQTKFGTDNSFSNSMMQFANLEGLSLNDTNLEGVDLTGSNSIETDFSKAKTTSLSSHGCISASTYLAKVREPQEILSPEDLPFQPYLVSQVSNCCNVASLMSVLFSNESISGPGEEGVIKVDSLMLSKLAYGIYAMGECEKILDLSFLYECEKMNRNKAARFFFDKLNKIATRDNSSPSESIDKPSNADSLIEHDKFISSVSDKSPDRIAEYATTLSEEIFNYDRLHFSTLKFYELMQEAINAKEKKASPNFTAMQEFSERLYYRVYHDVSAANPDDGSRTKVFQLYMCTALKLCGEPCKDLQSAAWIIQALSHQSFKNSESSGIKLSDNDNELLNDLFKYISPYGNFYHLRQLTCKRSVPFLPLITRDILMSMDESGTKSYLEKMLSLGSIQKEIRTHQRHLNNRQEVSGEADTVSDFIPATNNISLDDVRMFIRGKDSEPVLPSNETKTECIARKLSSTEPNRLNRKRLSTRDIPRFFGQKRFDANGEGANNNNAESGPMYQ
ncbi:RasGEF domain-containing protein [Legionella maioricensis]|uniref:Pentapeptide repeat-containing protein n=1 Tax=Legionella maioricensis TaxID=2896528 RepID=A0A9X2CZY1_9GAMM|nr:RasGEF domain-containing protein [Legionella maioricensis]MCL9683949.1 pentapeptide repeat-containing protein [Legionella maioricensis]MCL9688285.1 pentapeptide repeat-containing protein [Legionella maioricensis]